MFLSLPEVSPLLMFLINVLKTSEKWTGNGLGNGKQEKFSIFLNKALWDAPHPPSSPQNCTKVILYTPPLISTPTLDTYSLHLLLTPTLYPYSLPILSTPTLYS